MHRDPNTPAILGDIDKLAVTVKLMFDEHDRRWDARLEVRLRQLRSELRSDLREDLASAVNAATDRFLDYVRASNDETKAVADRVTALERRARRRR